MRLYELRKNPELNPKISPNELINKRFNDTKDTIGGTKNLFVSFTQIDKLGINPTTTGTTPFGIYAYQAEYVIDEIGEEGGMENLPFAGDGPYTNVFNANGNVLNVEDFNVDEVEELLVKLFPAEKQFINKAKIKAEQEARKSDEYGQFWYLTRLLAERLTTSPTYSKNHAVNWTTIFRRMGIDGIVDNGHGVIHPAEPTQAVFFSIKAIKNNERIRNKYSRENVSQAQLVGQRNDSLAKQYNFRNWTAQQFIQKIKEDPKNKEFINFLNPTARLDTLRYDEDLFHVLKNRTEEEQIFILKNSKKPEYWIQYGYIKSPVLVKYMTPKIAKLLLGAQFYNSSLFKDPNMVRTIIQYDQNDFFKLENPLRQTALDQIKKGMNKSRVVQFMKTKGIIL